MWKIGNVEIKNRVVLAPMAGICNSAFRRIAKEMGCGLIYAEMVSDKAICYNNCKTIDMLYMTEEERPITQQIFGSDVDSFVTAAKYIYENMHPDIIDINMGCPVPKIVKNFEGSALLNDINLAEKIISKCAKSTSKPISVKFRIGFRTDEDICVEFAKMCEGAGAQFITIHGRTREQFYSGNARYDSIIKASEQVKIPVFANGNIKTIEDYDFLVKQNNVFGVAIGRGALGNPNIFRELNGLTPIDKSTLIAQHYKYLKENFDEHYIQTNFKKHLCYYIDGTAHAKSTRNLIFTSQNIEQAINFALEAINAQS